MSSYWEVAQVTKTERIEQLEREVALLRAELQALRAASQYAPPYGSGSWTWPSQPFQVWCDTTTKQVAA